MPPRRFATPLADRRPPDAILQRAMQKDAEVQEQKRAFIARFLQRNPRLGRMAADTAWRQYWRQWFIDNARGQNIAIPPGWQAPSDRNYYYNQVRAQG